MKKLFLASLALVVICAGAVTFIYVSNNHSQCETKTQVSYGENGETITTETHICKEKFNL